MAELRAVIKDGLVIALYSGDAGSMVTKLVPEKLHHLKAGRLQENGNGDIVDVSTIDGFYIYEGVKYVKKPHDDAQYLDCDFDDRIVLDQDDVPSAASDEQNTALAESNMAARTLKQTNGVMLEGLELLFFALRERNVISDADLTPEFIAVLEERKALRVKIQGE